MFESQWCNVLVQCANEVRSQRSKAEGAFERMSLAVVTWGVVMVLLASAAQAQGRIVGVRSHGPDLEVVLEWGAEANPSVPVSLGIQDLYGGRSEEVLAFPVPGKAQKVVAYGLLERMLAGGMHYEVHLATHGETFSTEVYPFALALECKTPNTCKVEIRGGISAADSLLVSRELSEALDAMEKEGVKNVLSAVLAQAPHLAGDVYNLAWQYNYLAGRYASLEDCACHWETVAEHINDYCAGDCGGAHAFAVNVNSSAQFGGGEAASESTAEPEIRMFSIPGTSELTVDIRCTRQLGSGSSQSLLVGGEEWGTQIELDIPALAPCRGSCITSIQHQMTYDAALAVNSDSGVGTVHEEALYQLDGVTLFDVEWVLSTPVSGGADAGVYSTSASGAAVSGSTSFLSTQGTIDLQGTSGAATGWIETGFTMQATAVSTCTGPGLLEVSTAALATATDGEELNILIGDCHGGG